LLGPKGGAIGAEQSEWRGPPEMAAQVRKGTMCGGHESRWRQTFFVEQLMQMKVPEV
jgi:hypothetical protein